MRRSRLERLIVLGVLGLAVWLGAAGAAPAAVSSILLCLIPVPPLDGFQAIAPWLPAETREQLYSVSNVSMWVLVLALWYVQPLGHAFWSVVTFFTNLFGMDPYLSYVGWHAFRFWEH